MFELRRRDIFWSSSELLRNLRRRDLFWNSSNIMYDLWDRKVERQSRCHS